MKKVVSDVRKNPDGEIESELSNKLTNQLELLSLHKTIGKSLGKVVTDYSFDLNKQHFAVPSKSLGNQFFSIKNLRTLPIILCHLTIKIAIVQILQTKSKELHIHLLRYLIRYSKYITQSII